MATEPGEEQLRALFRDHYGPMVAFFVRRVGERADAEELTLAVFATAWRRIGELPDEAGVRAWLFGIARGLLANHRRQGKRRRRLQDRLSNLRERALPADSGDDTVVMAAFARLRPADQEVLRLTIWDGLSAAEAAAVLGCTVNALNVRAHRARTALRAEYERVHARREDLS